MPDAPDLRRADDRRIGELRDDIRSVARDVADIKGWLSEPEGTPQGRSLQRQINEMRTRFDPVEDWYQQTRGAWRLVLGSAVVLGIVGAVFGIASYFGLGH